jgi:phosphatidylinositol-3-phosphatase
VRGVVTLVALGAVIAFPAVSAGRGAPSQAASTAVCGGLSAAYNPAAPPAYDHVVVIMDENVSERNIVGNTAQAPYLNQLAAACALATHYHAATHPSQPNYMPPTSGTFPTYAGGPQPSGADNIFRQLQAADGSGGWRSYQESMSFNCNSPSSPLPFYKGHDPAEWYTDLKSPTNTCKLYDVPLSKLDAAITADTGSAPTDTFPRFAWVTPNKCNDMHWVTGCPEAQSQRIEAGDAWLKTYVTRLTQTDAYVKGRMLILITWDEGNADTHAKFNSDCTQPAIYTVDTSCSVALIAASAYVAPHTWDTTTTTYSHYAIFVTVEHILGLTPPAGSRTAPDMRATLKF